MKERERFKPSAWTFCPDLALRDLITGLALTVSQIWLQGSFYSFLAIFHAITVISALLYLPFGKFFHIFQRPAQLGVKLYQRTGESEAGAICSRCGERYASLMHMEDLKRVLPEVGFDYTMQGPVGNWQELCPACKRKTLSMAQLRLKRKRMAKAPASEELLKEQFGPHLNYVPRRLEETNLYIRPKSW